jgi:hypothetical protein
MPASLISRIDIFTLIDDYSLRFSFPPFRHSAFRCFHFRHAISLRFQSQLIITLAISHAIRHSFHAAMPLPPPAACRAFFIRFAATRRCRQPCLSLLMPLRFCDIFSCPPPRRPLYAAEMPPTPLRLPPFR